MCIYMYVAIGQSVSAIASPCPAPHQVRAIREVIRSTHQELQELQSQFAENRPLVLEVRSVAIGSITACKGSVHTTHILISGEIQGSLRNVPKCYLLFINHPFATSGRN